MALWSGSFPRTRWSSTENWSRWLEESAFRQFLRQAARPRWVVYAKRPFAGPRQTLEYLSLYTHRVALSPRRLVSLDPAQGTVSFSYKDYADGARRKIMTLRLEEFVRRFLLHLLPKGLVKIRHYGFLSNHGRQARLEKMRALLEKRPKPAGQTAPEPKLPSAQALLVALLLEPPGGSSAPRCPFCASLRLKVIRIITPGSFDSS